MHFDIVMPKLGESVTEGTVARWLKEVGDPIARDESVLEITTDKIDTDVPAIEGGILSEILVTEGTTVDVGERLGIITTEGEEVIVATGETDGRMTDEAGPSEKDTPPAQDPMHIERSSNGRSSQGRFYSPLVRRIAREEHIDLLELDTIHGSGRNGRVTKKDLLAHLKQRTGTAVSSPVDTTPDFDQAFTRTYGPDDADIVTMDGIRKTIAEHMVRSKRISPHVTSVSEVDMTKIVRHREQVKETFLKNEGFKLTLTPFFISAIVDALKAHQIMNASLDGDKIIMWKHVNLGMAVGLEKGVIVPVISKAEGMDFVGLARAAYDLAKRAHERRLLPDELQGGTFTLTNPGMWGTLFGTPVINQPEVGIIATGAVKKKWEVMEDETIAIRSIMFMSMSYDHRLVDGLNAARFTQSVTQNLEMFDFDQIGL